MSNNNQNQQNQQRRQSSESTTMASVTAKYCSGCGCDMTEAKAESEPITTHFLPVEITLHTDTECLHPCENFQLSICIYNASDYTLICPKLSFCTCNGVRICNPPSLADIKPKQKIELTVNAQTDRNLNCQCQLKACVTFCDGTCQCKATSEELVLPVSHNIGSVKIAKSMSPSCCVTSNDVTTVTLTVQNTGNTPLKEVCVKDQIPDGLFYQPHSTRVGNGMCIDQNPEKGIIIDTMPPHTTLTICYQLISIQPR